MRVVRSIAVVLIVGAVMVCAPTGCEQATSSGSPSGGPPNETVELPEEKPTYSFAEGLADEHPEIVTFMRRFLEICMAGDYTAYREMVSRQVEPESRSRFKQVLHSLRGIVIESIDEVEIRRLPEPTYLVVGRATLSPEAAARRHLTGPRGISILVFQEDGEYRMVNAPPSLQPGSEEHEPDAIPGAPTTSAPSYPWDEDEDY